MSMFGFNFTERCRRVLALAREEAGRHGHGYVSPDHILLGIIAEADGLGGHVLEFLAGDLQQLRADIDGVLPGPEGGVHSTPDLPYTARAKRALEGAMAEARALNHAYVGTEHLLLGLLAEGNALSIPLLKARNVTADRARQEILRLLGVPGAERDDDDDQSPVERAAITLHLRDGRIVAKEFDTLQKAVTFLARNGMR